MIAIKEWMAIDLASSRVGKHDWEFGPQSKDARTLGVGVFLKKEVTRKMESHPVRPQLAKGLPNYRGPIRKWLLLTLMALAAVGWPVFSGDLGGDEPAPLQGGIFYTVNTTSDTVVAGACANGNPGCSLRGAIQAANSHPGEDGIGFDLPVGSVINLTGALPNLTEGVAITGPGAHLLIVQRHTGGDYRIFTVTTNGTVTLSGLTIQSGSVLESDGGGILNSAVGTVNITNCNVRGNSVFGTSGTRTGGGIANPFGTVNITNSLINLNGVGASANNTHAKGGGIANGNGTVNVINSTFYSNDIVNANFQHGGGVANESGLVNVTNSTLTGNGGAEGGGIYNNGNNGGTVNVKSSIIAGNTTGGGGTGTPQDVFNATGGGGGLITSHGFNLIGINDGAAPTFPPGNPNANNDIVGTSASPIDPQLDPNGPEFNGGQTETIALLPASPAIDKGTSASLTGNLTTDQRGSGFPRIFDFPSIANAAGGNGTDIGAFELPVPCTNTFSNPANITINDNAVATPYPSNITVSGVTSYSRVTLTLNGLSHTFPGDIDIIVVAPGGQNAYVMSDVGGGGDVTGLTLIFDDNAAAAIPPDGPLTSGTYQPSNFDFNTDAFPAPAPVGGYFPTFFTFNNLGVGANGVWSLYVRDDLGSDTGSISGGWSINFVDPALGTLSAVSRKTHGAGTFDIDVPLSSATGIECRSGGATGDHQLVLTYPRPVSVTGSPQAQVTSGTGQIGTGGTPNGGAVTVNGTVVTVPLTNVANAQTIVVTLSGVTDGANTIDASVPMGVLLGDTNGNGSVNASDVSQTKAQTGQTVGVTNFRNDVTVNNSINASDVSLVKTKSGTSLAPSGGNGEGAFPLR